MMQEILGLVMDGLLLCFLGVAAYFAAKLSRQLQVFRQSRSELEKLVSDLTGSIAQAERSINGLRQAAQKAGLDLQDEINDARGLLDELHIIVESGEGIAARLEKGTAGRSRYDRKKTSYSGRESDEKTSPRQNLPPRPRFDDEGPAMFAIRDPEFEQPGDDDPVFDDSHDDYDDDLPAFLSNDTGANEMSKAERDLYQALHGGPRKRTPAGGV